MVTTHLNKKAVSSYPSNIMAANVSKDTTHRELMEVEGVPLLTLKLQVVNSVFGSTNASEFCEVMFNMYSSSELLELAKKENLKD